MTTSAHAAPPVRIDNNLQGIALLCGGLFLFSIQDVVIKLMSANFPVHQIMFVRGLIALPMLLVFVHFDGGFEKLRTRFPWQNLIRSISIVLSYMSYYLAVAALPIPTALTLLFTMPLWVTVLAVPLLGERIGWRRILGMMIGFAGVLVMLRPGFAELSWPMLLAVISAVTYAFASVLSRRTGVSDSASVMAFYTTMLMTYTGGAIGLAVHFSGVGVPDDPVLDFLLKPWAMPDSTAFIGFVSIGIISAMGFYVLTQAYRIGSPPAVAPFEYSNMIWAVMFSFAIFGTLPDQYTLFGMALVVAGGIYILRREKVRRDRPLAAKGPYRAR